MRAWEFARFLELAENASTVEFETFNPSAARELADVEASLRWTKMFLEGLR
jgi:hypothetical protein